LCKESSIEAVDENHGPFWNYNVLPKIPLWTCWASWSTVSLASEIYTNRNIVYSVNSSFPFSSWATRLLLVPNTTFGLISRLLIRRQVHRQTPALIQCFQHRTGWSVSLVSLFEVVVAVISCDSGHQQARSFSLTAKLFKPLMLFWMSQALVCRLLCLKDAILSISTQ
jgi:hypothetical protein